MGCRISHDTSSPKKQINQSQDNNTPSVAI